tara:strand:- start:433 stop:693 length:261 start_codon:yes stop_codon:yes gene_type:complete
MTTNQLAKEAWKKAKAMGWEAYAGFDLSDVLDMAGVVAFDPNHQRARVARWIEGQLSYSKWVDTADVDFYELLEEYLGRNDAYATN